MDYDYSVALIITTESEEAAIKNLYRWKPVEIDGDNQLYQEAEFYKDGESRKVVYARLKQMGMTAAACLSMKLIGIFHPRYLMLTGICAGVSLENIQEQIYGDVIVADVVMNYATGKFVPYSESDIKFGSMGYRPRLSIMEMDESLRSCVEEAIYSPENQNHVHFGPMASGASIVANTEVLIRQLRSRYEDTAGLDMEAYAVAYAAKDAPEPRPQALIIKSICDYNSQQDGEKFEKYAASTSMEFAQLLYEQFLPMA